MHTNTSSLARFAKCGLAAALCLFGAKAHAVMVEVKVENLASSGGLWFTPVFFGFHDGSFDSFDLGGSASAAIEAVAEGGDPAGLVAQISGIPGAVSSVLTGNGGPPGILFNPGDMASFVIDLDSTANAFLSFASMIIPSNDAFLGNDNPTAYGLFNPDGTVKDNFQINLYGANIWDAGTELNDGMGAAFSGLGGTSTDTSNLIAVHTGLNNFIGTPIGDGSTLGSAFSSDTPVARISVRAVPDSSPYVASMSFAALLAFRLVTRKRMKGEAA